MLRSRNLTTPFCVTGWVAAASLFLIGCEPHSSTDASPRQSARPSPPQLWSIGISGNQVESRSIQICADERVRSGFTSFTIAVGKQPCIAAEIKIHGMDKNYRCKIGDNEFGVSTTVTGDIDHEFTVSSTAINLDTRNTVYNRILRFRLLGACPAGRKVGQATDQNGNRVAATFIEGSDQLYVPK